MEKSVQINDKYQLFIQYDPKYYNNVIMVELMGKDDAGYFSVLLETYGFDLAVLGEIDLEEKSV